MSPGHERTTSVLTLNNQQMNIGTQEDLIQRYILACQNGDFATVKDLLDNNLVTVNDHLEDNVSGLHWASINNRLSICRYLVSKNADVNYQGGDLNATPLHWACRYGLVYIVDFLIQNGADATLCDGQGFNALHLSVHSSNIMLVVYILMMADIDIDSIDPNERTALHWAAYQGDALSVEVLLKFGANVNRIDNTGFTPLHWALIKANSLCLSNLVKSNGNGGACNIFATTNDGKTAFDIAIDMDSSKIFQEVLKECGKDSDGNDVKVPDLFLKNKKLPKVITFLVPYVVVGLSLEFFSDYYSLWQTLLFDSALFVMSHFFLSKLILPSYIHDKKRFFKSPLLAGIFSSVTVWVIINWFVYVLPNTLDDHGIANICFSILASSVVFCFYKCLSLNPGTIKPLPIKMKSNIDNGESFSDDDSTLVDADEKIRGAVISGIKDLLKNGKFDSKNFCIHTFVRRPLRSKYSEFSQALVARFDHFCPWIYNDIGLRNHKIFIFFVMSLEAAIILFAYLSINHFNHVSNLAVHYVYSNDDHTMKTVKRPPHTPFQVYNPVSDNDCTILTSSWCNGYSDSLPLFILNVFCIFQGLWILILLLVQFFQISKNLTTFEAAALNKPQNNYYYSPVPIELLTELENPSNNYSNGHSSIDNTTLEGNKSEDSGSDGNSSGNKNKSEAGHEPPDIFKLENHKGFFMALLKLIGITQFIFTFKNKNRLRASSFNFGFKVNCMEFWCLGNTSKSKYNIRNFFRIPAQDNGETYIGDQIVDYYKLYDYPIRRMSYKELV
ncbi:palmitoyltransferase [Saccharomycopsis crataegensis]|uniref:Palmitoyltransferase n=1 Tax=Saccharomycopsis crataegensis TaxID=43959 RepID=A0AAV5QP04_9ASCO|nr:palmitoyltransferase [Saccharomycopsis crataegensis]